jgi:hypothetical protein
MSNRRKWIGLFLVLAVAGTARAGDGVIEINQVSALAGGVVPGDTPGFPVTLNQAGSYRLTSNLVMPEAGSQPQNTTAITVSAPAVAIDLNGFSIIGNNTCNLSTCSANGSGVGILSSAEGTSASYGMVRGMGSDGVRLGLLARVDRVIVMNNGGNGIRAGNASVVQNCQVRSNRLHGINVTDTSTVRDNVADVNGLNGIKVTGNLKLPRFRGHPDNWGRGVHETGATSVHGSGAGLRAQ